MLKIMLYLKKLNKHYFFLFIIWLLLIFLINPIGDFSLNDSWRYAYPVKSLVKYGTYELNASFAPIFFFQAIYAYPFCLLFGFSFTILRISSLVISFLGIIFFYNIIKKISKSSQTALLTSIILIFNPLFLSLSFSFMTDIPFLTLSIISFYFFYIFTIKNKISSLIFAFIFSSFAFLIRQPGIIYPIIFGITYLIFNKASKKSLLILFSFIILSIFLYFETEQIKILLRVEHSYIKVSSQFINTLLESPKFFITEILKKIIKTIIYIGLFSLPILPLIKFSKFKHSIWHFVLIFFNILLLIAIIKANKIFPFGGNVLQNMYIGPSLMKESGISNHFLILPEQFMIFLNFIGQISGSYILIIIYKQFIKKLRLFYVFIIVSGIIYLLLMSITSFFDRYSLLPFVITLILILVSVKKQLKTINKITFILLIIPFIWFSVAATHDYLSLHRTKKIAFNSLLAKKINIKEMDAGQEIQGRYNYQLNFKQKQNKNWWWVNDDKYVISIGKIKNYELVNKYSYYSYLKLTEVSVYTLKKKL